MTSRNPVVSLMTVLMVNQAALRGMSFAGCFHVQLRLYADDYSRLVVVHRQCDNSVCLLDTNVTLNHGQWLNINRPSYQATVNIL